MRILELNQEWVYDAKDIDLKYIEQIPTPKEVEERINRIVSRSTFLLVMEYRKYLREKESDKMNHSKEWVDIFYKYKNPDSILKRKEDERRKFIRSLTNY
jgi:hypothetical protein